LLAEGIGGSEGIRVNVLTYVSPDCFMGEFLLPIPGSLSFVEGDWFSPDFDCLVDGGMHIPPLQTQSPGQSLSALQLGFWWTIFSPTLHAHAQAPGL
jgi:hypothetical protein